MSIASPLFDSRSYGMRTSIGGLSHAKFEQYTLAARHIYDLVIRTFNFFDLEYFLFAGSLIGFLRDGRFPLWMDDLDVIIFEDQISRFEAEVVPFLRACGLNCIPCADPVGGGFHILGLQLGPSREATIPLTDEIEIRIPWAQVDVFFTRVDEKGFIRNLAGWGLYHNNDIPIHWVRPGKFLDIDTLNVRVFDLYNQDIWKEYGDVLNNIIVSSHGTVYLSLSNIPWQIFYREFSLFVSETALDIFPELNLDQLSGFSFVSGRVFTPLSTASFWSIVLSVLDDRSEWIQIFHADQILWVMDLKRILPSVKIKVEISTAKSLAYALLLSNFIDSISCSSDQIKSQYDHGISCLKLLG